MRAAGEGVAAIMANLVVLAPWLIFGAVLAVICYWNPAHLRRILHAYEAHHNQHRPHRSLHGAAPLKPLPEPVDLARHRVRRQACVGGLISEYHLVAGYGRGFRHAQGRAHLAGS
jgi:hypothetical protein